MKELIILGSGESAKECPFDAEVWETKDFDLAKFPYEEIVMGFKDYFRPVASYMIALAVYLGYEKIKLYGIDMDSEWDYVADKPRITYWLGVAKGKGILWEIAESSKLHRVMKENVKKKYRGARAGKVIRTNKDFKDFVEVARSNRDPYCFVSGIDKSAISVKSYTADGEEVEGWHHMT